jgi:hypothetical protein
LRPIEIALELDDSTQVRESRGESGFITERPPDSNTLLERLRRRDEITLPPLDIPESFKCQSA